MSPAQTDTYHHGDLRRALIDEAGKTLEKAGVDAISFRGLARALGVSHAAPGHHFADRNELLSELAADGYSGLAHALEAAMQDHSPDTWLERTGMAYVRFALNNPERYRMMFASRLMTEDCPDRLRVESSRAYLLLLEAAYGGVPEIDPAVYRLQTAELRAWSLVHGAVMLWLDGQLGPDVDEATFLTLTEEMLSETFA
ncbi:MAG TPA: WHG domain-containing protein [Acidimicrobiia bacterium]